MHDKDDRAPEQWCMTGHALHGTLRSCAGEWGCDALVCEEEIIYTLFTLSQVSESESCDVTGV